MDMEKQSAQTKSFAAEPKAKMIKQQFPGSLLVEPLAALYEKRLEAAVTRLMENPSIAETIQNNPSLKLVLRSALESGKIPENEGVGQARYALQEAEWSIELTDKLEKYTKIHGVRISTDMAMTQEMLLSCVSKEAVQDKTFLDYARHMLFRLYSFGYDSEKFKNNPALLNATANYIHCGYGLMRSLKLSPALIKKFWHQYSVFQIAGIFEDVRQVFGTADFRKIPGRVHMEATFANFLLSRRYPNAAAIKHALKKNTADVRGTFGEGSRREASFVLWLLEGKYPDAAAINEAIKRHTTDVQETFGKEHNSEASFVRWLLEGRYPDAEAVKKAYVVIVEKRKELLRFHQLGNAEPPVLTGLGEQDAFEKIEPLLKKIAENFRYSDLGLEDAQQAVFLAALEFLHEGKRDATDILDIAIERVTHVAGLFSRKMVDHLDEERFLPVDERPFARKKAVFKY